jgi:hypothetical protein
MVSLYSNLNSAIEEQGSAFGPGLVNLLLYGPLDKSKISSNNLNILQTAEFINEQRYEHQIVPKIQSIVTSLTDSTVKLSKDKHSLISKLEILPFEEIRSKIKSKYRGQFELDETTKNGLYSNELLNNNDYIRFAFLNGLLVSTRLKKHNNSKKKYQIICEENNLNINEILNFTCDVANDPLEFWTNFDDYAKKYSSTGTKLGNYTDLMLGDDFGLKIVDLTQKRSNKHLDELSKKGSSVQIPGFKMILGRFDDHRKRLDKFRPGGLHYTLIDAGLTNFPIEVQVQSIKSFIYDKFGPNSHELYSFRGKKSSNKY